VRRQLNLLNAPAHEEATMVIDNKDLLLDLVEWVGRKPKPYDEVMAAWRTSCPRLQIWEDAVDHGFVSRRHIGTEGTLVDITEKGLGFLRDNGRVAS
jgi:hypothetical protein